MIIFVTDMKNYFLAIISGILFSISWPIDGIVFFIFFAFVPLFIICENFKFIKNKGSLADIAPTILKIMNIRTPEEMQGSCLIE